MITNGFVIALGLTAAVAAALSAVAVLSIPKNGPFSPGRVPANAHEDGTDQYHPKPTPTPAVLKGRIASIKTLLLGSNCRK